MEIYQRMKDLREDHDLSQEDIAKVLQTTQEQVPKPLPRRRARWRAILISAPGSPGSMVAR